MADVNALALGSDPSTAAFGAGVAQIQAGQAQAQYDVQHERLNNQFVNRTIPDFWSSEGMRGSAYSGNAQVRQQRLGQDKMNAESDLGMQLHQRIADLTQQRLYSFLGV